MVENHDLIASILYKCVPFMLYWWDAELDVLSAGASAVVSAVV
jgi:hypothetical protein